MQEFTDDLIQGRILHKLCRAGKYKASHTAIENLYRYLPRHMQDRAKENVEKLLQKGLLIKKITNYGVHVSLDYTGEKIVIIEQLAQKYIRYIVHLGERST